MSDEGRSQRPQTMGNVLGMLADAMRSQRQRGLPRLQPDQILRIENAVEALKSQAPGPNFERGPSAPQAPIASTGPSKNPETPAPSPVPPTTATRTMGGAERLERPDAEILKQKVEALSALKQVDRVTTSPASAPAAKADSEPAMPWMVDESDPVALKQAEDARRAVELARQNQAFTQSTNPAPTPASTGMSEKRSALVDPRQAAINSPLVEEGPPPDMRRFEESDSPVPTEKVRTASAPRAVEAAPPSRPVEPARVPLTALESIQANIRSCTRCSLCNTRKNAVPGQGASKTRLMFVGEGPGVLDDEFGEPFRDESGELLTRMIQAMGLQREDVYISNVIKCVTPKNRQPFPDELAACSAHLRAEIAEVKPEVIIALGKTATEWFLGQGVKLSSVRGRWHNLNGIGLMPTYHPTYLLHQTSAKAHVWADLQLVMKHLKLSPTR